MSVLTLLQDAVGGPLNSSLQAWWLPACMSVASVGLPAGGLWRVTGQQIAGVAAAEAEADEDAPPAPTPGKAGAKGASKGTGKGADASPPEDVRGPHASLAVRLTVSAAPASGFNCRVVPARAAGQQQAEQNFL